MEHVAKEFGKAVRQLRLARELTQERLAEAADISVEYVNKIERGLTKSPPSWAILWRLARALRVEIVMGKNNWTLRLQRSRPPTPRISGR